MMTLHERAMAVFTGNQPDRLPWFSDLSYWVAGQRAMGKMPDHYRGPGGYLKLHQDLGVGIFAFAPPVCRFEHDEDLFKTVTEHEGDRTIQEITTPEGVLRTVHQYSSLTFSMAPLAYAVSTPDDLRALRCYYRGQNTVADGKRYEEILSLWGDQGIAVLWAPRSPLGQVAVQWAGVENLSFLSADFPEDVEETLSLIADRQDEVYRIICESPATVIEIGDNLSGETMGGLFRKYSAPYFRKRAKQLHEAGKYLGVHLDGTMKGLISSVAETGLDYIEAVTPNPVGDLSVEEIFPLVSDRTILWGGVPGAMFAPPYQWQDIKSLIERIYALPEARNRFILCSADQVPVNGDIELVKRIADFVKSRPL